MNLPASPRPIHALIVEDDLTMVATYQSLLEANHVQGHFFASIGEAEQALGRQRYLLALLDLNLPDGSGVTLVEKITRRSPDCTIIMISAEESVDAALAATRAGASDYLVKPVALERLALTLRNALETARLRSMVREVESTGRFRFHSFIGVSPPMQALYRMIEMVSQSKAPVFILGESGTGKELCAEALHALSPRGERQMLSINCAAIPRDLMESEIFGHVKGAFSGATADRKGAAMQADGGTLFLDELCEMDLNLQAKLLRLLQTGEMRRVGESQARRVDLRIICATNRNPHAEMEAGRLREDLFYRLFVVPVELPPLRQRGSDVLLIAHAMVTKYAAEEGKKIREISPQAQELLMAHGWPGNVRELLNVLRAAVIFSSGATLEAATIAPLLGKSPRQAASLVHGPRQAANLVREVRDPAGAARPAPQHGTIDFTVSTIRPLAELESEAIGRAMTLCGGNMGRAAKALGINPSTLYRKLRQDAPG